MAIAFFMIQVREPNVDDWRKPHHLIEYLKVTVDMPSKLGADGTSMFNWFVDALIAVHNYM